MDFDGSSDSASDGGFDYSFFWDAGDDSEPASSRSDYAGTGGYSYTPDPIAARERAIQRFPATRERQLWNLLNIGGLDVAGTPKIVEEKAQRCWRVINKFGRTSRRTTFPELLGAVPEAVEEVVINGLAKTEVRLTRMDIAALIQMVPGWRAEIAVRNSTTALPPMLDDHLCIAFRSSTSHFALGTVKVAGSEFVTIPLFTAAAAIPLPQYLPPEIRDAGRVEVRGRDLWRAVDSMRDQIDGIAVNPCDRGILMERPALRLVLPTRMAEVDHAEGTGIDRNGGTLCAGLAIAHALSRLEGIPCGWFKRNAYQRQTAAEAAGWLSSVLTLIAAAPLLPLETARTLKGWRYLRTHPVCRKRAWLQARIDEAISLSKHLGPWGK